MCPGRELELSADHIYNKYNNSHSSSIAVTAERILLKQNQSRNGIVLLDVFIRSGPGPPIEMTIAPLLVQATTQYRNDGPANLIIDSCNKCSSR